MTVLLLQTTSVRAQSEQTAPRMMPEVPSAVDSFVDEGGGPAGAFGQRLRLFSEAQAGVAGFFGARQSLVGHEGRPELALVATVEKHVGATLLRADAVFAREIDEDQRDAELALAALHPLSRRIALGVAGRAVLDLDEGRTDGGEVRWEARGGAAASVRLGERASLSLHGGAVALASPTVIRAGPFALAAVGGWF